MARRISGPKTGETRRASAARPASGRETEPLSREAILRFVAENPGRTAKRDIAKAFGLKGEDKIELKRLLRELEDDGLLDRRDKDFAPAGVLPPVVALDIVARDEDGGLIGQPVEPPKDGAMPNVALGVPRRVDGALAGLGSRVMARLTPLEAGADPAYSGRILKVFDKRREAALGVLRALADGTWRIEPAERRQPEFIVDPADRGGAESGDLVEIEPLHPGRYGLPKAKVLSVVGSLTSEKAVSMIAIHAHDIPHIFPDAAIAEADAARPAAMAGREDWRDLPLVTIDPADAKDHDDAVFAVADADPANPGGMIATVAIADVAAYVRPGSALDREALKRGNSVYFPDRVVPMLPERISNDLCSLREGEDRPALAVRMTFASDGRKLRHTFHRVMIRSQARLSYPQAQAAIDGQPDDRTSALLEPVLRPIWDAYAILKRGRDSRHPLDLDLPERKILLNADGAVDRVVVPPRLDAHRLIEEFMIQANVAAAETLEAKRQALVYRIHDAPSLTKQESLREFLQTIGQSLARGSELRPAQFNSILARVRGTEQEQLVNEVVLRSQSQAEYSPANIGHFGLNLRRYAHFTSPIRRYADLIVHRALIAALGLGKDGLTPAEEARLEDTASLISVAERRAMTAERDTNDRLIAGFLATRKGESFEGRISGVTKSGLFVKLPAYGADGFIPISMLGDDYYIHDETMQALVGRSSGAGYRLGDAVDVKLVEAAPLAGAMRFEMESEPRPMPGATRSYHKSRPPRDVRKRAGPAKPGRKRR